MEEKVIITESAATLRSVARQMLRGKWKVAVLGSLVYLLAIYVPDAIINIVLYQSPLASVFSMIYMLLVSGALCFGYYHLMLSIQRKQSANVADVFSGFEQYGRAFCVSILYELIVVLWFIPYIVLFLVGVTCLSLDNPISSAFGALFIIGGIATLILPIRVSMSYSMCYFLAIDNPKMRALEALRKSKELMNGNKWKLFCLDFSFIGWVLLCIVPVIIITIIVCIAAVIPLAAQMMNDTAMMNAMYTNSYEAQNYVMSNFGRGFLATLYIGLFVGCVGFLWITPYMAQANTVFYDFLIGKMGMQRQLSKTTVGETVSLSKPTEDSPSQLQPSSPPQTDSTVQRVDSVEQSDNQPPKGEA